MSNLATRHDDDDQLQGGEIDLRVLARGLWRRKLWIIVPTVLVAMLASAFVLTTDPYYRAGALVLIENREAVVPRAGAEREQALPDEQAVATQVQFIQSRDLVRRVTGALGLGADREFAPETSSVFGDALSALGLADASLPLSERVVDNVARNLTVYPVSGARVIGLEFVATDPDTAAKVANGFLDAYFDVQRDAKRDVNRQATQYLSDEIAGMRSRVSEAEDRVETFRARAGLLVGSNNTTLNAQQLGDAIIQLSAARTQQAESRAKSDTIRDMLRQGRPAEALDIANSELVRALAQQRSQLAATIASEGRTLLPQHPRMRELTAQLTALEGQVRGEAEKLARAYENEAKTAGARVASFETRLEVLKAAAATANGQDVQLRALEREARAQRDLLEQLLARYREASARDNPEALVADARIISRAASPTEPYFPKKVPTVALATLGAFVLALFAAATAEVFSGVARRTDGDASTPPASQASSFGRLQTPDHTADIGTPSDAAVGRTPPRGRAEPPPDAIEIADATLIAALARQLAATPARDGALRILATGARPSVSVGDVAANLARMLSDTGRRVIAVDAGGGAPRPTIEAEPGLAELLSGEATFAQAIHRDQGSRVHIVPCGGAPFASLDRPAQRRLGVVLDALALTYDFVLLTVPGGADGNAPFADHCAAAIVVSDSGGADAATVETHQSLKATGIEDVVVLLVRAGDGAPDDASRLAA